MQLGRVEMSEREATWAAVYTHNVYLSIYLSLSLYIYIYIHMYMYI